MSGRKGWIDVDPNGLRKNSSLAKAISELAQNGLDTDAATLVTIDITSHSHGKGRVVVEDNDPVGYLRLSDAYTMLAPSSKAGDDTKAGIFNVGEKEFLSFAIEGKIVSTTGAVFFNADGSRRETKRTKRDAGSLHDFILPMSKVDQAAMVARLHEIIVREDRELRVNGVEVPHRPVLHETTASLPVQVVDKDDPYRFVIRRQKVEITLHMPGAGGPKLHVIGMPVQPIDLPFSVNVGRRIKLDQARDMIAEGDLQVIRAAVVNLLAEKDALSVDDAVEFGMSTIGKHSTPEATSKVMRLAYGEDFLVAGVRPGPNSDAASAGRTLVYTRTLSSDARGAIERTRTVDPTFALTPSKAGFGDGLDTGTPGHVVERAAWTPAAVSFVQWCVDAYRDTTGKAVRVTIYDGGTNSALASAGDGDLNFYLPNLGGWAWFEPGNEQEQVRVAIHEFGHLVAANGVEHSPSWGHACIDVASKLMVRGVTP
jgi:hypothetical protein